MNSIRIVAKIVLVSCSACCSAQQSTRPEPRTLKPFPPPVTVLSDSKKFNALELGPGNKFVVRQIPKDFEIEDIALNTNGELVAILWASGRTEIRRASDGNLVKQFHALQYGLGFADADRSLVSGDSGGNILISDITTGKAARKLKADLGPRKYGVRAVLYKPESDWWAYVDGEVGRAVKLSDGKILTNFGEATDFALSQDGKKIWTVGRDAVSVYSTDTWKLETEWKLRSSTPPTQEPEFALGTTPEGTAFAAVPSVDGLMIYPESAQANITAPGAATIDSKDNLMLVAGPTMRLMSLDGTQRCEWQQYPHSRKGASADGSWIAISDTQQVSLWKMTDLLAACN